MVRTRRGDQMHVRQQADWKAKRLPEGIEMKVELTSIDVNAHRPKTEEVHESLEVRAKTPEHQQDATSASLSDLIGQEVRPALGPVDKSDRSAETATGDMQKWLNERDFAITGNPVASFAKARVEAGNLTAEAAKRELPPLHVEMEPQQRIELLVLRTLMDKLFERFGRRLDEDPITGDEPPGESDQPPDDDRALNISL